MGIFSNIFRKLRFLPLLLIVVAVPLTVHASGGRGLSVQVEGGREVVYLRFPGQGKTRVFNLSNPERLVLDVPAGSVKDISGLPDAYKGKQIRNIRSGRFDAQTQRIVLELAGKPSSLGTQTKTSGGETTIRVTLGAASSAKGETKRVVEEKPLVVIDAGHGGQDPGTTGTRGTREKDIVLEYARALRKALLEGGKYRVQLTRDKDEFILLRERVNIARQAGASLFISLHADSALVGDARGLSVYTVSEKASDAEAAALAARENKVDMVYGMDLSAQSQDVADILVSLAQRDTMNKSDAFAGGLVRALNGGRVRLLENAHRFAGFAVLKAPDIPSVLVEIGFLSNPEEERMLKSNAYRDKLVKALARGIDGYFMARKKQSA